MSLSFFWLFSQGFRWFLITWRHKKLLASNNAMFEEVEGSSFLPSSATQLHVRDEFCAIIRSLLYNKCSPKKHSGTFSPILFFSFSDPFLSTCSFVDVVFQFFFCEPKETKKDHCANVCKNHQRQVRGSKTSCWKRPRNRMAIFYHFFDIKATSNAWKATIMRHEFSPRAYIEYTTCMYDIAYNITWRWTKIDSIISGMIFQFFFSVWVY